MVTSTKKSRTQAQSSMQSPVEFISATDAAEMIGVTPKTLCNWRSMQKPNQPPFYKKHGGAPRYKLHEVQQWIESGGRDFS